MRPAMKTKPNAQLWVLSAAGDADSAYLRDKVDDGRARIESGLESRVCYIEWSAPEDAAPDAPETWAACMPALGHTVTLEVVASEWDSMPRDDFLRSNLNIWIDTQAKPGIIANDAWAKNRVPDDDSEVWVGEPMWAIDVSPLRDITSFGLAARPVDPDAEVFLECVGQLDGTDGAVEKLKELSQLFGGKRVALSRGDAAASLRPDLEKAGFEVLMYNTADKADACGWFFDTVLAGKVRHMDDPVLNGAVTSAGRRDKGEGAWIFKRASLRDITPLYAVLFAGWAWLNNRPSDPYDIAQSLG